VSELGLIEMTRQRVRASLYQTQTQPVPTCGGTGASSPRDGGAPHRARRCAAPAADAKEKHLTVRVHPVVALYVLEEEPGLMKGLEKSLGVKIALRDDPLVAQDEFRLLATVGHQDLTQKFNLG
jgi:Ribonuclease G/E